MSDHQAQIIKYIEENQKEFQDAAKQIHAHPEVSNYEFYACKLLSEILSSRGFHVEENAAGHRTGFSASCSSKKPGPTVAFLAEYDALPNLGHGCGHNLIGTIAAFSAIAVSQVLDEVGGEVRVYGTPGEEGGEQGSAKESFVREGYFKDVDAALEAHPAVVNTLTPRTLALDPIDIEFWGKAAHASTAPEQGINALDALILTYNGINALRQHLPKDVQVHGIVVNGGSAPNIVPDYSRGRFFIRAETRAQVDAVNRKIQNIAAGAASMTGATWKVSFFQNKIDDLIPNVKLDAVFKKHADELGEQLSEITQFPTTDAGNVSHAVPTLHVSLKSLEENAPAHSIAFRDGCVKDYALNSIVRGAKLLSLTALDLLENPELTAEIKAYHKQLLNR
ncbi:MAG TPA: M20 family metallopeptidase [Caproicibacter sp.]|nr:M20 family metallopeptidase [Caproicibacter sp.]